MENILKYKLIGDDDYKVWSLTDDYVTMELIYEICLGKVKNLVECIIPENVTSIDDFAFAHCSSLKKITLSCGLKTICDNAFEMCFDLKEINIPSSVTSIGDNAFIFCAGLKKVIIPEGVASIGETAFAWCKSLEEVYIPDSVKHIDKYAFEGCENLTIHVSSEEMKNRVKKMLGGSSFSILSFKGDGYDNEYEMSSHILTQELVYSVLKDNYGYITECSIPEGVTEIGEGTFLGCRNLQKVYLPSSLKRIDVGAFAWCPSLQKIYVSNKNQYEELKSMLGPILCEKVEILHSVVDIKYMIIPTPVTEIDAKAFQNVEKDDITKMKRAAIIASKSSNTARNDFEQTVLYLKKMYAEAAYLPNSRDIQTWILEKYYGSDFIIKDTELELPENIKHLSTSDFFGYIYLESVTLPSGLETIEEDAFIYLPNLSRIYVSSIEQYDYVINAINPDLIGLVGIKENVNRK